MGSLLEQYVTLPIGQLGQDHACDFFIVADGPAFRIRSSTYPVEQGGVE